MNHAADYFFFLSMQEIFDNSNLVLMPMENVNRTQNYKIICILSDVLVGPEGLVRKNPLNPGSNKNAELTASFL